MTRKAGPISADRLRSFVERVEKLEEERKAIGGDIRDVYSEAKGVGYDVKTMRKIVQIRAQDVADRDEAEALLDTYMLALGMDRGQTLAQPTEEELEERASRIIGQVDRCMALVEDDKPPKITAIQELIGCSAGKAHKLRGFVEKRIADGFSRSNAIEREKVSAGKPDGPGSALVTTEQEATALEEMGSPQWQADCLKWRGKVLTGKHGHWCPDWDDLPIDETSPEWPCPCAARETGSATVVATGNLDALSPAVGDPPDEVPTRSAEEEAWHAKCAGYAADDEAEYQASLIGGPGCAEVVLGAVGSLQGDRVAEQDQAVDLIPAFLDRRQASA